MRTITDLTERPPTPAVLTIGGFDGVHLGHQALIASVVEGAKRHRVTAVALTFDPSPRAVLRPDQLVSYLTPLAQKLAIFEQLGLDEAIVVPFTKELSQVEAPDFVAWLRRYLPFVELWEGEGFALGHGRTGNTGVLAQLGEQYGYTLNIAPLVEVDGEPVSSTRVRNCLLEGNVALAARLLGRPFEVSGTVVAGSRRGRELGYPTANLQMPPQQLLPADGIYASWLVRPSTGEVLPSLTSIGIRPTFENSERLVEVYILNYNADLYGETLTTRFVEFLRPQERYDGIEPLIAQMKRDEQSAAEILKRNA